MSALQRLAAVLALAAAGAVVLLAAGSSTAATAAGMALLGVAAVLLVGLAFLEVGLSEDRARAAERKRARMDRPAGDANARAARRPRPWRRTRGPHDR